MEILGLNDQDNQAVTELICEQFPAFYQSEQRLSFVYSAENTLRIKEENGWEITYFSRASIFRGIACVMARLEDKNVEIKETPVFEALALMLDNSRNAVQKQQTLKKIIRISALMGFNRLMLYMEDTYTVEGEPYFGYMRGGFSPDELREIDGYADRFGIELIPCIQTLAHLDTIFRWQCYSACRDYADALLADEDKTYELIDKMLGSLSKCIKSKRINIGMDEAAAVGRGAHLDRFGEEERTKIILRHLKRVLKICEKYGYEPMMWSDMFGKRNLDADGNIPQSTIDNFPSGVDMVFWAYESQSKEFYDKSFERHMTLPENRLGFAGSACSWFGIVPLNVFSRGALMPALESAAEHNIKDVILTVWGDNGADASIFSGMSTWQTYAEYCWTGSFDEENIAKKMRVCAGADYQSFMDMEQICNLPERDCFGTRNFNPYRYMLYQDVLLGLFDRHVPNGSNGHYASCADMFRKARETNGEWAYLFDSMAALCDVLKIKAELGIELKKAYDSADRKKLREIADNELAELEKYLVKYQVEIRKQWNKENKAFGFEVQDTRLGGLLARVRDARVTVCEYLNGITDRIEQLEVDRLYYDCRPESSDMPIIRHAVNWNANVSASLI